MGGPTRSSHSCPNFNDLQDQDILRPSFLNRTFTNRTDWGCHSASPVCMNKASLETKGKDFKVDSPFACNGWDARRRLRGLECGVWARGWEKIDGIFWKGSGGTRGVLGYSRVFGGVLRAVVTALMGFGKAVAAR